VKSPPTTVRRKETFVIQAWYNVTSSLNPHLIILAYRVGIVSVLLDLDSFT